MKTTKLWMMALAAVMVAFVFAFTPKQADESVKVDQIQEQAMVLMVSDTIVHDADEGMEGMDPEATDEDMENEMKNAQDHMDDAHDQMNDEMHKGHDHMKDEMHKGHDQMKDQSDKMKNQSDY
ncbi:hypothetical protein [Persicobacter psychrovividus]|uniref:Pentapeptide MXKDX repeat protein n=2 Tax=Persicobacter psychrovividus TaxID=387638 RepID=A0ABN6L714_9BACT|nr:hypothetical protein PEPS_10560 [Persicobacter psychrovividus]